MKKISLGTSDFKKIIDSNYYFIDKTLIIKEFLEDSGEIVLTPRPRRFGKTLNLSIIKYFLEKTNEDRRYLFNGLNIEKETEIMKKQGKYPLIYITFKDDKHRDFNSFIEIFKFKIADIYATFKFIIEKLDKTDIKYFNNILNRNSSISELEISILKLSEFLNKYYNQNVIILIDEYDTPIHHSYFEGYYAEMIGFIRNFLSSALKDNINLEKAMITGILRVAKESIFSGLNNIEVYTLLSERYSKQFGFTEEETTKLLKYYNLDNNIENFKKWYNGYIFGSTTIYNPWSVLSYINKIDRNFMPYWVNTSENKIIKELLANASEEVKVELENLYQGGYVNTEVNEDIVMQDIDKGKENIWSFLLLSGYLKPIEKNFNDTTYLYEYKLAIPNIEIKTLYRNIIDKWFKEGYISQDYNNMIKALVIGDIELFEEYFQEYVIKSFSYFDIQGETPEKVYHAFILGMLISLSGTHEVVSNRESGLGRYDVSVIPKDVSKPGIVMEFKSLRLRSKKSLEDGMKIAKEQISKKLYETELKSRGIDNIIKLALVFKGKEVLIEQVID